MFKQLIGSEVSLIITTFDQARFLADAIQSALAQTMRPGEIIVVDDGSRDNPAAIVNRFENVRYIRQENQGLAAARNTGWKAATGEYVAFLDADDKLHPKATMTNVKQFQNCSNCAFVYGAYRYIDEVGKPLRSIPIRPVTKDPFCGFLSGNLIGMHGTVLYRRDRLAEVGGFDQTLPACEDYDIYLRLSQLYPVSYTSECLADYRRHGANMSNDIPLMLRTALKVLGRYKEIARSRTEWMAAYEQGVAGWKSHYAQMQLAQIKAVRSRSAFARQFLNTVAVARVAPHVVTEASWTLIRRWQRKRRSSRRLEAAVRQTAPVSDEFGFDRGKPVDRRYVEAFLSAYSTDIQGRVLEIGDNEYTRRFGRERVTKSDILNRYEGNPASTLVGDLSDGEKFPSDTFDCIVLTQTLHLLFDLRSAVATVWRMLQPGGTLLVTVPWVSPIDRGEWGESWYWSISPSGLRRLLSDQFGADRVEIKHYGNVYSATAFLYGFAEHQLDFGNLDINDPYCPVIVAGRAQKDGI